MQEARLADFDLTTPKGRVATYLDYLWKDHAYLRLGFSNAHWISDELVRTNQPWPHQLAEWKKRGVKEQREYAILTAEISASHTSPERRSTPPTQHPTPPTFPPTFFSALFFLRF